MSIEAHLRQSLVAGALACAAAIVMLPPAAAAWPANDPPALQSARNQYKAGNYSAAIAALLPLASQSGASGDIYDLLGRCYYELRDYDNAAANGEKAIAANPTNSSFHDWLGREYGGKADRDHSFSAAKSVKKEFEAAVNLDPSNIDARRDLEEYDLDAPWIVGGDKSEALMQVEAIAAIDPIQGHLARAEYDQNQKKHDEAQDEYRQVVNAKSATVAEVLDAAAFFEHENMLADLDAAVRSAAKIAADDPRVSFHRAVQGILSNADLPGAERDLKSYLANTPDRSDWPSHAAAREWLGRLYELEGKNQDAAEQYRAALQLDPGRKEARQRLQKLSKT
jgi:tetratricopeptide (TPR) repeat protein